MHFLDVQRFNNAAKTLKPEVIKKKCGQVTDNWGARRSLKRVSSFIQAEIRSSNEVTHQQTGYVHLWTLILRAGQRRHWWLYPAASFAQHIRKQHQEWTSSAACPCPVTKQEIQTNQKQAYASTHIDLSLTYLQILHSIFCEVIQTLSASSKLVEELNGFLHKWCIVWCHLKSTRKAQK